MNLAPLAAQLEALRRTPLAQISPALDHLYALLGRPVEPAADAAAEALVRQALGGIPSPSLVISFLPSWLRPQVETTSTEAAGALQSADCRTAYVLRRTVTPWLRS